MNINRSKVSSVIAAIASASAVASDPDVIAAKDNVAVMKRMRAVNVVSDADVDAAIVVLNCMIAIASA